MPQYALTDMSFPEVAIVAASLDILGGQGVQARSLVEALEGDAHRVTFVPINPRFPRGLEWLRRIPVIRTLVNECIYLPSLLRLASVDVVHIFSASYWSFLLAPLPAILAARALNKRVVLHYHSGEADDHLSHWGALVHPWLRLAHAIVVPSEYLREVFARHGYAAHVIPNVVDVSRFRYRERQPLRPRVLSVRNLEPYYRVDLIIDAFARFMLRQPDATLTIAGYGSEEPRLRSLAASLAGDAVRFVGKVDQEAMAGLYANHDIFVNASVVDNQPVSILEAFASGLPVISTPTGDIRYMVRHGKTGLIARAGDAVALLDALSAVWNDPEAARRRARHARREVEAFTWTAVRDRWTGIYREGARFDEITLAPEPR
jgi:glycosyltransferase involved in cell wall biosynthesis